MGIFRPNKLKYNADEVERKSNSYIINFVNKFIDSVTGIMDNFRARVDEMDGNLMKKADSDIVNTHINNKNNPHNVTADQINTYTKEEIIDKLSGMDVQKANKASTLSGYGITNAYTTTEIDTMIGDIKTTLDNIIALQESYGGGVDS